MAVEIPFAFRLLSANDAPNDNQQGLIGISPVLNDLRRDLIHVGVRCRFVFRCRFPLGGFFFAFFFAMLAGSTEPELVNMSQIQTDPLPGR